MKIGFDAKRLFANTTGLGNYSRTLVDNLLRYHKDDLYFLYSPFSAKYGKRFLMNERLRCYCATTPFKALWRSRGIVNQLQKDRIDIFHGLSHEIPIGLMHSGIKSIVTMHDMIYKILPHTFPMIDRFFYHRKFQYSCNHANKIIAISESTKRDLCNYFHIDEDKIEVVYQVCSSLYYEEGLDKNPCKINQVRTKYKLPPEYFLSVGTVEERKNLELIIRAYQYLPLSFQLPLVVIGGGKKYQTKMKLLSRSLGLEEKIVWIDSVQILTDLLRIYQAASMLIYPSRYEGFGLPVVEALLCKTPVITSNTSSLPEAGGNYSLYISPDDDKGLARGIEKISRDSTYATTMKEEGYLYAMRMFSPQKQTNQLYKIYQNLLGN